MMEYDVYPYEAKLKYLVVRPKGSVMAGFAIEEDAVKYAESNGWDVRIAARNPRNAGRNCLYSERDERKIADRIAQGIPLRQVAKEFNCSLGYVHKLKTEHAKNNH